MFDACMVVGLAGGSVFAVMFGFGCGMVAIEVLEHWLRNKGWMR
jgi:Fe2+ transport system protein B